MRSSILGAMLVFGGGIAFAKSIGVLKDITIARTYGLSSEIDQYFLLLSMVLFVFGVIDGAIKSVAIPAIQNAASLFSHCETKVKSAFFYMVLIAAVITLTSALLLHVFIDTNEIVFYSAVFQKEVLIFLLLSLSLMVLNGYFQSLLQTNFKFLVSGLIPVFTPLSVLLFAIWGTNSFGVELAIGHMVGSAIECVVLAVCLFFKSKFKFVKVSFKDVSKTLLPSSIMAVGCFFMASTLIVDQIMALPLGEGSVSTLTYASRLPTLICSVVAMIMGTVLLPYFSKCVAEEGASSIDAITTQLAIGCIVVGSCITFMAVNYSTEIVSLVFQGGEFQLSQVKTVAMVQSAYMFQTPFYLVDIILVRALLANNLQKPIVYCAGGSLFLNIVFNYIFIEIYGVQGIAISTSVCAIANLALHIFVYYRCVKLELIGSRL